MSGDIDYNSIIANYTDGFSDLQAEINRLRAELASEKRLVEAYKADYEKAVLNSDCLREALTTIVDWDRVPITGQWRKSLVDIIRSICDCARAALAPRPPEDAK